MISGGNWHPFESHRQDQIRQGSNSGNKKVSFLTNRSRCMDMVDAKPATGHSEISGCHAAAALGKSTWTGNSLSM